ncbi:MULTISPECIES: DUF3108 domain-containing protein [unclassified Duganella]|uniref:DUF3108 domain-containing protein n=1 Tax=unclassified Duganella TaxID=2636909 RepID=UPI000E34296C|nr:MULTISPECIES: DUF3108 domain-containing protein [unclassified Duganella]RFP10050.1 DUF3108 domain-containing protein [Duganella sp. BJB475]RFP25645.1 DUF3108 domain-containing protein [Duganella sp. BJB476]
MSLSTHLFQRRRLLVLCAATLALHYLAIDWVGDRLATQSHRPSPLPQSLMTAQLRLALPKHVETPPAAEVQPLPPAAKPARKRKPEPVPAPEAAPEPAAPPPAVADTAPTAEAPAADSGTSSSAGAQAGAAQAQTGTPSPPDTSGATPVAAVPVDAPPAQGMRRYKVNLPPSASMDMDVARVDADGTKWSGSAVMTWHTDGSNYQASAEAGISLLITRLNALVMRSVGTIDDYGIAPATSTQKRGRRAETATHFNRDAGTITFSASERSYPLMVGAQDMATVPFQLGGIGRADINQFGSDIEMQVGDEREATLFRFQLVGEEELNTKMGKVVTWHLSRPPRPGSYSSRLDIWLAPGLNWYPVQLRNTEASGALTTQTVSKITMTESGK